MKNNQRKTPAQARRIISIAATIRSENKGDIPSDVTGSYTGMTRENEHPIQDADDL